MYGKYQITNKSTNNKMSQQNSSYSPFNNYFGLADVITSINLPTTRSILNPFATPFIPSVAISESETDSDDQKYFYSEITQT